MGVTHNPIIKIKKKPKIILTPYSLKRVPPPRRGVKIQAESLGDIFFKKVGYNNYGNNTYTLAPLRRAKFARV
jgi:hypothetical protein